MSVNRRWDGLEAPSWYIAGERILREGQFGLFRLPPGASFLSEQMRQNLQLGLEASLCKTTRNNERLTLFLVAVTHTDTARNFQESVEWTMQSDGWLEDAAGPISALGAAKAVRANWAWAVPGTAIIRSIRQYWNTNNTIVCWWRESTGRWEKPARSLSSRRARRSRAGKPMQLMTGDVKLGLGVRRRGLNYMGLALLTTCW